MSASYVPCTVHGTVLGMRPVVQFLVGLVATLAIYHLGLGMVQGVTDILAAPSVTTTSCVDSGAPSTVDVTGAMRFNECAELDPSTVRDLR
jgi:hypothetical protein